VFRLNHRNLGKKPASRRAQRLETLGLIVIVILILALTITRSWHYIAWSAR
jgi:hypothetical protein